MEALSETKWDVVISGTGLQQSLLALALSRSGKNILHVDPNEFYGAAEAAFSLQELDDWAAKYGSAEASSNFANVQVNKNANDAEGQLSASRSYNIALAPQLIHAKSALLLQLVSSKAFRQIEFLAVGSFHVFQRGDGEDAFPSLSRIPVTREDVFSDTSIPTRAKRALMKFVKFTLEYDSEPHTELWKPRAQEPLLEFLASEFKLDERLQSAVIALTLSLDGAITVQDGLAAIHRHMTSMGQFGAGFAAVYPKWGGLSEVAQVGCRASAVGGAVYMLGVSITDVQQASRDPDLPLDISLSNDVTVKAKALVQESTSQNQGDRSLSRLTAVINSDLSSLFELTVIGAPTPAVTVVAFPAGSISDDDGQSSKYPIYAMIHSSETGECLTGQSSIYLSTISTATSKSLLEKALVSLLASVAGESAAATVLYRVAYEQRSGSGDVSVDGAILDLPSLPLDLAFTDSVMDRVRTAWKAVAATSDEEAYMNFDDREGVVDDDRYDYD